MVWPSLGKCETFVAFQYSNRDLNCGHETGFGYH